MHIGTPISVLLISHDISAHLLDPMDDLGPDDVILWLLPHKGEGFDGAAFTTSKPENKLRFVAARRDVPEQRDIPQMSEREPSSQWSIDSSRIPTPSR